MKIFETNIPDVLIFEPNFYGDERGFFYESFNQSLFEDSVKRKVDFVQDNHSRSTKSVLRGLHMQSAPFEQGKLVRCTLGEVFDVAVDLRPNSKSFGEWVGVILSAENKKQLWIPEGFAHGFYVLSENAEFQYKTTNYYSPSHEIGIKWDDKKIGIEWPVEGEVILSSKDKNSISLEQFMNDKQ